MNVDARGSFTELLKTAECGQFSINISKLGITKGEHWHNTKWEFFIMVVGHGLIQQRKIGSEEVAVIKKCRKYFDTILAHTGQNYDYNLNGVFFKDLELDDPEVYLNEVGKDLTCEKISYR